VFEGGGGGGLKREPTLVHDWVFICPSYSCSHKVDTHVSFGLELCLDPWILQQPGRRRNSSASAPTCTSDQSQYWYDLIAVVQHSGYLNAGHYTTHAQNPVSGIWYYYNDAVVRPSVPVSAADSVQETISSCDDSSGTCTSASRSTVSSQDRQALERVLVSPAAYLLLYKRRRTPQIGESDNVQLRAVLASSDAAEDGVAPI
jgi:hypothetical protein